MVLFLQLMCRFITVFVRHCMNELCVYIDVCVQSTLCVYMFVYTDLYMSLQIHMFVYNICLYIYVLVHIRFIYVCVYTNGLCIYYTYECLCIYTI